MITYIHNEAKQVGNETYIWFIGNCLSTDYKPTELIYDASKLFELDTLKCFVYSAADHRWNETVGGSSGGGILVANMSPLGGESNDGYVIDKTYREIINAQYTIIKSTAELHDGSTIIAYSAIDNIKVSDGSGKIPSMCELTILFDGNYIKFGPGSLDSYPEHIEGEPVV